MGLFRQSQNLRLVTRKGFGQPIINALRVTERPDRTST